MPRRRISEVQAWGWTTNHRRGSTPTCSRESARQRHGGEAQCDDGGRDERRTDSSSRRARQSGAERSRARIFQTAACNDQRKKRVERAAAGERDTNNQTNEASEEKHQQTNDREMQSVSIILRSMPRLDHAVPTPLHTGDRCADARVDAAVWHATRVKERRAASRGASQQLARSSRSSLCLVAVAVALLCCVFCFVVLTSGRGSVVRRPLREEERSGGGAAGKERTANER